MYFHDEPPIPQQRSENVIMWTRSLCRAQRQYSTIIDISPQLFVDSEVTRGRRICDYYVDNPVS